MIEDWSIKDPFEQFSVGGLFAGQVSFSSLFFELTRY